MAFDKSGIAFPITLDVKKDNSGVGFVVGQYDKDSKYLEISLTDDGLDYTIPVGATASLNGTKPISANIFIDAITIEDNKLYIYLTEQACLMNGYFPVDITLYSGTKVIKIPYFMMTVTKAAVSSDAVVSADEVNVLNALILETSVIISDGNDLIASMTALEGTVDSNEDARLIAEGLRVTAESNRVSVELLRVSAESGRVNAESDRVIAELARVNAEIARASAEVLRQDAITGEAYRIANEVTRVSSENTRISDESTRQTFYNAYASTVDYNALTAYVVANKVKYLGGCYQCIVPNTGNAPTYNTDNTWWICIAAKGSDGAGGDVMSDGSVPMDKLTVGTRKTGSTEGEMSVSVGADNDVSAQASIVLGISNNISGIMDSVVGEYNTAVRTFGSNITGIHNISFEGDIYVASNPNNITHSFTLELKYPLVATQTFAVNDEIYLVIRLYENTYKKAIITNISDTTIITDYTGDLTNIIYAIRCDSAINQGALVFGNSNISDGGNAIGIENIVAERSLAIGDLNELLHDMVVGMGTGLESSRDNSILMGQYNFPRSGNLFEFGNGTDNDNRSNAVELTDVGTLKVAGDFVAGDGSSFEGVKTINSETVGSGVLYNSGLSVTAQSTPNMTVATSSGTAYLPTGERALISAVASQAITTADATNPRKDIMYVNSSKVTSYLAGTPSATPTAPSLPSGGVLLAEIYVGAGVTSITNANITDRRTIIKSNADLTALVTDIPNQTVLKSKSIDVLTANPTDLFDGRIWIIKHIEVTEADKLSNGGILSGSASRGTYTYMSSPNYKPPTSINLKKIIIKFQTGDTTTEHNTANPVRCRICADNGSGYPNESVVYGTATYSSIPTGLATIFYAEFIFITAVVLTGGVLYHFVLDVPSGTGNTFCRTFKLHPQPTNDAFSMQIYTGSWIPNQEEWEPTYKLIKIT